MKKLNGSIILNIILLVAILLLTSQAVQAARPVPLPTTYISRWTWVEEGNSTFVHALTWLPRYADVFVALPSGNAVLTPGDPASVIPYSSLPDNCGKIDHITSNELVFSNLCGYPLYIRVTLTAP